MSDPDDLEKRDIYGIRLSPINITVENGIIHEAQKGKTPNPKKARISGNARITRY
jgi:hypothetical protein